MSAQLPYRAADGIRIPPREPAQQEHIDSICQAVQETICSTLFDWSALTEQEQLAIALEIDIYLQTRLRHLWRNV